MCRSKAEGGRRCNGARRRDLAAVAAAPDATRVPLRGGLSSTVALVTAPDGRRAVHKTPRPGFGPDDNRFFADGDELAAALGRAVGAPVADVLRDGPDAVWVEHIDGPTVDDPALTGGRDGARIGLLDALTGNTDRDGNMRLRGGRPVAFDHGGAWLPVEIGDTGPYLREPSAPMRHFVDGETWRDDPPISAGEVARLRPRVEALRPRFEARGRGAWLDYSLAALDEIGRRAG
jgi:hypothetical protein